MHAAPGKQVQVDVVDALATIVAAVDDAAIALFGNSLRARVIRGRHYQLAHQNLI